LDTVAIFLRALVIPIGAVAAERHQRKWGAPAARNRILKNQLDIIYSVIVKYNTKHESTANRDADCKALEET
jgi:hypothetical protein